LQRRELALLRDRLGTGGGLGGYSGGIEKKEFLLALEKKRVIL
jgi:hypothetical protein